MDYIGIDIGSTASKVAVKGDHDLHFVLPTGWSSKETCQTIKDRLLEDGIDVLSDDSKVVATGYGRVAVDFADHVITEITCHARGAHFLDPKVRTVVDIGGQDSKVISTASDGSVQDFLMNDKCAAGTGRFLQVLSGILGMELAELGEAAGRGKPAAISSMCAVFAETEIIGLLARGTPPADIAAGVFRSIARRMRGLAARIPLRGECTFTGGLATSPSFSRLLSEELGVPVNVPEYPQLVGAIGAALIAARI